MTRSGRLRSRTRIRAFVVGAIAGVVLGGAIAAGAALTGSTGPWECATSTTDIHCQLVTTTSGASTSTSSPATTTTVGSGGTTIIPAGPSCPSSTTSSTYQGLTLTVAQAIRAAYLGGFTGVTNIRAVVGIGRAESSLCVKVWHYHPTQTCPGFPQPCADRGWLQINDHFWPQFPDSQVFDPVGAAAATKTIYTQTGTWNTWDTWASGTAQNLQPSATTVCATVPATGC